jgi:GT2 family glycosyltransferase
VAVVVTLQPPLAVLELVKTVRACGADVLVVDNGSGAASQRLLDRMVEAGVEVTRWPTNRGLAAGLEAGVVRAVATGATALLTLDQDCVITPDALTRLLTRFDAARRSDVQPPLGLLGPGVTGGVGYPLTEVTGHPGLLATPDVLQSASVLSTEALAAVGGFRVGFFVDSVDSEMCLRLRAAGYLVGVDPEVAMAHAPGSPRKVRVGRWSATASGHSATRRYFITRNKIILFGRYGRREPAWARYHAAHLAVQNLLAVTVEDDRLRKVLAVLLGACHGLLGREGPAPRWLAAGPGGPRP